MPGLDFEQKVEGLQGYHAALEELDPSNPDRSEIANPDFFYSSRGHSASFPLREAKRRVAFDISCHGRQEYFNRVLSAKDLRKDDEELRLERADVLAVMTGPITPEVREERAERISVVLADIVSNKTLLLAEYNTFYCHYDGAVEIAADPERPLFGVFRNSHISSHDLTIQYREPGGDPADTSADQLVTFDVTKLFSPQDPLILEPAEGRVA